MRPEYSEMEDAYFRAVITISSFRVAGESRTEAGARRAALYEAEKTYRSYHPSYRVRNPYPDNFSDREGTKWSRVPPSKRDQMGDYRFVDAEDEEDFADIESMLTWDVRPGDANPED